MSENGTRIELPELKQDGMGIDIDRETFALTLRMYRLRQNMTQAALGAAWGLSRYTIMRAEKGKGISWEQAYKLFVKLATALQKEDAELQRQS